MKFRNLDINHDFLAGYVIGYNQASNVDRSELLGLLAELYNEHQITWDYYQSLRSLLLLNA